MARSYRLGWWLTTTRIIVPSILPYALTGLRISASIAVIVSVVTELVGGARGIGQAITVTQVDGQLPAMYAWIITAGLLGVAINLIFTAVERPLLSWHPSQRGGTLMKALTPTRILMRLWLPVLLVAIWLFASAGSTSLYFPPLAEILSVFGRDWLGARVVSDLLPSLGKFLAGFAISAVLGIGIGVLLGMSRVARALTEPLILFLRSVPGPALVPFGILIVGIGAGMNIFIIVLGAIWPTLLGTISGVRSLDPQLVDMARSYRLTLGQRLRYVILPNAGPQIFAGLRTTLQLSIILIVVSGMVASVSGIGYAVLYSQQTFDVAETWSGTILLGILGYIASLIFIQVEKRILAWQIGLRATAGKD